MNKNLDKLNHELPQSFQFLPDVICLSETKIKNNPLINVTLNGYQPIIHADSPSNAGGVGVFVAEKYSVNTLEKNELKCTCEDVWLKLEEKATKVTFILGVVYRHPRGDVNSFISFFNEKLLRLNNNSNSIYCVVGNFNINVIITKGRWCQRRLTRFNPHWNIVQAII